MYSYVSLFCTFFFSLERIEDYRGQGKVMNNAVWNSFAIPQSFKFDIETHLRVLNVIGIRCQNNSEMDFENRILEFEWNECHFQIESWGIFIISLENFVPMNALHFICNKYFGFLKSMERSWNIIEFDHAIFCNFF